MIVNVNTELRKLRPGEFYKLGLILNPSDNWKKLMASVTKDGTNDIPKFPGEYITIIEQAARQERKLAAEIFLEEWATMGKKRPTVGLLLDLLMETELFRAADYLAQDILNVAAPRRPASGPAAAVDIDAIADLLLRQNLEPESASNDSDFCGRTTNEIRLSQINYPMHVFDTETTTNDDNLDVGVIEMQYAESRSHQVLEAAAAFDDQKSTSDHSRAKIVEKIDSSKSSREISDLIKFSVSDSQRSKGFSRSDILKFDHEDTDPNRKIDLCEAVVPNLSLLCLNSTSKSDSDSKMNYAMSQKIEMTSAQLPACLGRFGASESPITVRKIADQDNFYFNRELISAELPLCINNRIDGNSSEGDLRVNSSKLSSDTLDNRSSDSCEIETEENADPAAEFPCFVVEAGRKGQPDGKEEIVQREPGKNALDSQELPVTVLEFHNR